MSLPSQAARSGVGSRAYTRSRRRGPISPRGAGAIAVVIIGSSAGLAWWALSTDRGDADPRDGVREAIGGAKPPELVRAEPEVIRQPKPEPVPVEIRMGDGIDAGVPAPKAISDGEPTLGEELRPDAPPDPTDAKVITETSEAVRRLVEEAGKDPDPVKARAIYSQALRSGALGEDEADAVRRLARAINDDLVFSSRVAPGDDLAAAHVVQSGDSLVRIANKHAPNVDWRFIQRINKLSDPHKIRVGQKLKVVKGPFHAVVTKSAYRLDLYAGDGESAVYVRSFAVGLGESDGTPAGTFLVKPGSKLINPHWVNPRTGQAFNADDPENPIGERWLGLEGQGSSAGLNGYGIHGTIDPESIGKQRSMGCVRLAAEDIEILYELLGEGVSRVEIRP